MEKTVNSCPPVEDPRLCIQITYLMRQRACITSQSIPTFSSPRTAEPDLQLEADPSRCARVLLR